MDGEEIDESRLGKIMRRLLARFNRVGFMPKELGSGIHVSNSSSEKSTRSVLFGRDI